MSEDRTANALEQLKVAKSYKYLEIILQSIWAAFTSHIKEKRLTAIWAMADIQSLRKLSLEIAMKFDLRIVPALT